MQRKKISEGKSISLAFGFCLIIFLILLGYFGWKMVKVLSLSHFDGKHEYILEVDNATQTKAIVFLPESQTINILHVEGMPSGVSLGSFLAIPVDSVIKDNSSGVASLLQNEIFSFGKAGIPFVDAIKLWLYTNSIQQGNITSQIISASSSQETIDALVPKLFTDKTFYQEAATIAIINASGVSGIGNKFAKYLTNVGGNVIMVNTADNLQDNTIFSYTGSYTYSVSKIEKILLLKAQQLDKKGALADITITIGKDFARKLAH